MSKSKPKPKTKQPWVVIHGNPIEGFRVIGPFGSEAEARYFTEFFCTHDQGFEVRAVSPFEVKPDTAEKFTWKEIKKQFDDPKIRKKTSVTA